MKPLGKILLLTFSIVLFKAYMAMAFVQPGDSTLNAEKLISNADRAVLFIVKSAQETSDAKLKRSNKDSEPFWASVKKLNSNIDKLTKYNFLKDENFHKTLAETVTAKEEVLTTYEMLEANDASVKEGIDKASKTINLLYQNYSKEALRMKKGGSLSAEEKQKLDQVKAQNKELQKKLDELEGKVSGNEKMLKKIKKIREKSNEVVHCHNNSAGFFFAMSAMNMINGWMWGSHWWWGPWGGWYPGFYFNYVDIYVNVIDDYTYDWGYMDGVIDAYDYYEYEVELEQVEMDLMDEYLYEMEIENELYDQYDMMYDETWDDAGDFYDNTQEHDFMDDGYEPELMDEFDEYDQMDYMDDYQQYDQMDYTDDFSDFDFGDFDEW